MITTLALDLGTKCGHATNIDTGILAGTWKLSTEAQLKKARSVSPGLRDRDPRMVEFQAQLRLVLPFVQRVAWEDVEFSTSTAQTQLWASFRGILWAELEAFPTIARVPVPVGTLKKFATGSGNADKDEMRMHLSAAVSTGRLTLAPNSPISDLDDNAIDAVWLNHYATTHGL